MKLPALGLLERRTLGLAVLAAGAVLLVAPIVLGGWIVSILGLPLIGAGLFQIVGLVRGEGTPTRHEYASAIVSILLGLVLLVSPSLALSGLVLAVSLFFVADGGIKVYGAFAESGSRRVWGLFDGAFTAALGALVWTVATPRLGVLAISAIVGLRLAVTGWTLVFAPQRAGVPPVPPDPRVHPDYRLGLADSDLVARLQRPLVEHAGRTAQENVTWCLTLLAIFFLVHALRTDARWSFIGLLSPFVAVVGDGAVALLLAIVVLFPLRLLWRKLSRPIERVAWHRLADLAASRLEPGPLERILGFWLGGRLQFALEMRELGYSLHFAFWRLLRNGLPATAVLIAVNSIWGFSWYFNSENWASAVWQDLTQERVDAWRRRMAIEVERDAVAKGVPRDEIFAVHPPGIADGDFSFVVIGDTGEGDPSQMVLRDQLIAAGEREDVRFLVLSSDVIYPDGKMKDYETNFYLPFKGFHKPIYAIPGNHDWYDSNEGFNANFLTPDAAPIALRARLAEDLHTEAITTDRRFDEITAEAARLRAAYGIDDGLQRAPYFEVHAPGFSLIAVDTGILRSIDETERLWLEAALARAGDDYKLVVLGHPFFVAGAYTAADDPDFRAIDDLLRRHRVDAVMAGDTHDFEAYRIARDGRETLHFVNGGGGAYLSIGTALGFAPRPETRDYAIYPRTDELTDKLERETPVWKTPFYWWMRWLHGWPFDDEMVSGAFDFNRAPFFQSFLVVHVERSRGRVRYALYGANGPLRWRDLQVGGDIRPPGAGDGDLVEFVAPHPFPP